MLTAEQLKTTQEVLDALLKVRDGIRAGEYALVPSVLNYQVPEGKRGFNMGVECLNYAGCGTLACIGGWVALELGEDPSEFVQSSHWDTPLNKLFWDSVSGNETLEDAADAIDNLLETGDPKWSKVWKKNHRSEEYYGD